MSVLATLDLASKNWVFDVAPETPSPDLQIGFKDNGGPVDQFVDLSFGFTVTANGESVMEKSYPPGNVKYVATDQTYVTNDRVDLASDDEVVLSVWATNDGVTTAGEVSFVVPRPEQPYPSWTWNGTGWEPPVPYPGEEPGYVWDEDLQDWATIDPISEQGDD